MNKKYSIYAVGIIFLAYAIYVPINLNNSKKDHKIFLSSRLAGKLRIVSGSSGGEKFILNNSNQRYLFFSKLAYLNNYQSFADIAEIGDSIYKESFSDTLLLLKKSGKIYKFTFQEQN